MKLPPSKAAQTPRRPRLTPSEALATLESTDPDIAASARSQMPNPPAQEPTPADVPSPESAGEATPEPVEVPPAASRSKKVVEKPAKAPARRGRPPVHTTEGETERVAVYIAASLNLEVAGHLVALRRQGEKWSHRSFTEEALRFYIQQLRKQGVLPTE